MSPTFQEQSRTGSADDPAVADDLPHPGRTDWRDIGLGAFLLGAAGLLVALFVLLGGWRLGHGLHVTAVFDDATGLVVDAPVVVAGVSVGRVEHLGVKAGKAVALLDLRRDADLRADVSAVIRSRSLLGEKVVDLVGSSAGAPALSGGATITRTRSNVEPDQILTRLAPLLERVDPEDLARLFHAGAQALGSPGFSRLGSLASRLDGLLEAGGPKALTLLDRAERAAERAERLLAALETSLPAMERLVEHADAVAVRAPRLMDRTDALLGRTDTLVGRTLGTIASLDELVATPGARVLGRADVLLGRLPASLDRLDRMADRVTVTLEQAQPTLDRISVFLSEPTLRRLLREEGVKVHIVP